MAQFHLHKMRRGWLLPYLLAADEPENGGYGRWDYWSDACLRRIVPPGPIPWIDFSDTPRPDSAKHIRRTLLGCVHKGYDYERAWYQFVRWLLHGFGRRGLEREVASTPPQVRNFWYETFDLHLMLKSPIDWGSYILEHRMPDMGRGTTGLARASGYYSTPTDICKVMCSVVFGEPTEETKLKTFLEPCVGTGKILLVASNYTLRLSGQEIQYELCLCTELNGWLYMPWLVRMPGYMVEVLEKESHIGYTKEAIQTPISA